MQPGLAVRSCPRAIVHAVLAAQSTSCQQSYCDVFRSACKNGR